MTGGEWEKPLAEKLWPVTEKCSRNRIDKR
jgi:hypothetical protein